MKRLCSAVVLALQLHAGGLKKKPVPPSLIDQMIHEAELKKRENLSPQPGPGSLYAPKGVFANSTREFRAASVDDLVTILVSDTTSAVANGTTNTQRKSTATGSVPSLLGQT